MKNKMDFTESIKELTKKLFESGDLTLSDTKFFNKHGYEIICNDGKVSEIILAKE